MDVRDRGGLPPRKRREGEGDPPVGARRGEAQPADGRRDVRREIGRVAQRAGERELRRGLRELAQEADGVALVPGATPPDGVAVDQHERVRAHGTSSRQSATTDAAASSQLVPRRGMGRG